MILSLQVVLCHQTVPVGLVDPSLQHFLVGLVGLDFLAFLVSLGHLLVLLHLVVQVGLGSLCRLMDQAVQVPHGHQGIQGVLIGLLSHLVL